MHLRARAHLALFTVNLLYGVNYVVAKGLMPDVIGASGFILLRVLGAGALFWVLRAIYPEPIAPRDLPRLLLCAVTGVAVNQLMFFHGLMRTSPINASIIMVATPVLVLLLSAMLIGERLTTSKVLGVSLGAGGAIGMVLHGANGQAASAHGWGDLFILVNAIAYGLYLVLVKPLMARYSAVTVMAWGFLFGLFMVLPFGWNELWSVRWGSLSAPIWASLGFVVVMVTFVAYLLNTWALRHMNASVVGVYIYLQPVLAALFSWWFMWLGPERIGLPGRYDTTIGPIQMLCAAAIFTGVYLVGRRTRCA